MEEQTVTTSRGMTLPVVGIQSLLDKFYASHKLPEPPMYLIPTAGGPPVQAPLTQQIVDKGEATPEEKVAWEKYQTDLRAAQTKLSSDLMRLMLLRGVKAEMPEDDTWAREQEMAGIDVPTDPLERRLHWLQTEVVDGVEDSQRVMLAVMGASGVPEDLLSQMEATFRSAIRRLGRPNGQGNPGEPAQGPVVRQSAVPANGRSHAQRHPRAVKVRRPQPRG